MCLNVHPQFFFRNIIAYAPNPDSPAKTCIRSRHLQMNVNYSTLRLDFFTPASMRNLPLLILFLMLQEFLGFSQRHFQKGAVITLQGNTIHESIDCRGWTFDPEKFAFTHSMPKDTLIKLSLPDARAFIIGKTVVCEKYTINASQGAVNLDRLPDKIDTSSVAKTIFLKVPVKGEPLLPFSYTNRIITRYYFQTTGVSIPQELQLNINSPNHTEVKLKICLGQLPLFGSKYGMNAIEQQRRISASSYITQDLIPIVKESNRQKDKKETSKHATVFPENIQHSLKDESSSIQINSIKS